MPRPGSYLLATRHPWSCVLFVLPLLLAYEIGLYVLSQGQSETAQRRRYHAAVVAGAGRLHATFLRSPTLLGAVLILWSICRRGDRPEEFLAVWVGMVLESAIYALGLWAISRGMWPILEGLGIKLTYLVCATGGAAQTSVLSEPAARQIVGFIGAGIYEETLFRLLLFSALMWILRLADFPRPVAGVLAVLGSAFLFAAAHNLGPHGEPFDGYVFTFRTLAGVYFTILYYFRGFGIAVGAHAGYDVLVGVLMA